MVEATLIKQLELFYPGIDVVTLTASDGETWRSRRLAKVDGAIIGHNVDTDSAHINAVISGNEVTLNLNGVTDEKVTLQMFGTA